MRIPGAEKAIGNLIKWSAKEDWTPYREQVFAEHFDIICDRFGTSEKEIAELLGDSFDMLFCSVFEDFLTSRFGDEGEKNVIDDYLKRRGWREKVPAKRYLAALRDSVLSLYEVVDLDPGRNMTVRDSVWGGDLVTVEEKLGSETAVRWDQIAGRIVRVNKKNYFTGSMLLFPQEVADELLSGIEEMVKNIRKKLEREAKKQREPVDIRDRDLREVFLSSSARLFTQTWLIDVLDRASAPLPEVRNSDGDEIVFSETRFPITGEIAEVVAGLDEIDEFEKDDIDELRWTWHGHGSPSKRVSRGKGLAFETDDGAGRTILGDMIAAEVDDGRRVVTENPTAIGFVPFCARWAYETYVAPKRACASIADLTEDELSGFAGALREMVIRYDNLWQMPFPYILVLHNAPTDNEEHAGFHFHVEFHPPLRKPNLLKHLAGPESGGGSFLSDTWPEEKAAELKAVSDIRYDDR